MTVVISEDRPDSADAIMLIRELDADLIRRYGEHEVHGLRPADVVDAAFVFLIAWIEGQAVGCGGLRPLDGGTAEIKRMFVRPAFRGRGIARQILASIEARAHERGHSYLQLETGVGQPEAIRLYERAGFHRIAAFGDYLGNPLSVCFGKQTSLARVRPTPVLETKRLLLQPLALTDAEQIQALFPQWEIVRYLTTRVPWPYPPDGASHWCRDIVLPAVERGEEWCWTLRLKTGPTRIIGVIHLMTTENNNRGFWIAPPWQRQGLMTEACNAVTDHWFDELKFPRLRVPKMVGNVGSRRISEKQGMRIVATKEQSYVSGRFLTEIWEITADEWHAR